MEAWKTEIAAFLNSPESDACDIITCFYDNWFMDRMLKHGDVMRKSAVMRVGAAEYEFIDEKGWSNLDMEIHEQLQSKRPNSEHAIAARLEHHDKRPLEAYYAKHEQYANWESNRYRQLMQTPEMFAKLTARQKKKYSLILKPWFGLAYFFACYFAKLGILDGYPGLVFARGKMRYFRSIREKILNG